VVRYLKMICDGSNESDFANYHQSDAANSRLIG